MFVYTYENYHGGTNNLCVTIDWRTGERAASTKGKEAAARNLRRRLRKIARQEAAGKPIFHPNLI